MALSKVVENTACWVCRASDLEPFSEATLDANSLGPESFRITDSHYGRVPRLLRCSACGFVQIGDPLEPLRYYEALTDPEYEATREQRAVQARRLLASPHVARAEGRLLDVGAGSGILVEAALDLGFAAQGIDPSKWLVDVAISKGLPVIEGTLPHPNASGPYDIVCLVDVIEHVTDPRALLATVQKIVRANGTVLIVTPDVTSCVARVLGRRWWHFRVAHVGYFSQASLDKALAAEGFARTGAWRPTWYFPVGYLWERLGRYISPLNRIRLPTWLRSITIPLNLRDSLAATYRRL